jgi:glycosyltransferase involved in cell wall biosynthesis
MQVRAMSDSALVTIGLPVYNSSRYVRQSLDSLLAQTYRDFTLVISDNASTDGTEAICREYAARDPRIQYSRNEINIGNPGNFNRVFSLTRTKYLKWSTSDDLWAPTFLERAVEVMERDPSIALCYPKCFIVDAEGANPTPFEDTLHLMQTDPGERFLTLIDSIKLAHQHLGLIRMSALQRTHLLGAFVGSDINLLAELTLYGKYCELPERLFYRRFHKTSGSWKRGDKDHEATYYLAAAKPNIGLV